MMARRRSRFEKSEESSRRSLLAWEVDKIQFSVGRAKMAWSVHSARPEMH